MRILILGGGGLGTVYAGYLARAGAEVTLLVKPAHAGRFEQQAVTIDGLVEFSAPVRVVSGADGLGRFDYLLLCVKGRDTETALASVRGLDVEAALSVQNGVRKDELLARAFGRERVLGAVSMVGATLHRPGHALHSLAMATYLGELDGGDSPRGERLASVLREAGLSAVCVPDIVTREWDKLALFLRTAPVAAITRLDIATILLDPDLVQLCVRIVKEVAAVAATEGHPLESLAEGTIGDPRRSEAAMIEAFHDNSRAFRAQGPPVYPSMAQDVIAGRPTEVEDTAGDVLLRAARHGIATPVLEICVRLVRALERAVAPEARE